MTLNYLFYKYINLFYLMREAIFNFNFLFIEIIITKESNPGFLSYGLQMKPFFLKTKKSNRFTTFKLYFFDCLTNNTENMQLNMQRSALNRDRFLKYILCFKIIVPTIKIE